MLIRCVLIDRDVSMREALSRYLEKYDISVRLGESGDDLRHLLSEPGETDIVVLDLALLDGDGLDLCRWMNTTLRQPLIVITAQGDVVSRVVALESGADDYIEKPVDKREVVARIRAVVRRAAPAPSRSLPGPGVKLGIWTLNEMHRALQKNDGVSVSLSSADFRLLKAFVARPGEVLSRAHLMTQMSDNPSSRECHLRAVDLAVSRLRQKLADVPSLALIIRTVRGKGYQLVRPDLLP